VNSLKILLLSFVLNRHHTFLNERQPFFICHRFQCLVRPHLQGSVRPVSHGEAAKGSPHEVVHALVEVVEEGNCAKKVCCPRCHSFIASYAPFWHSFNLAALFFLVLEVEDVTLGITGLCTWCTYSIIRDGIWLTLYICNY
jgi:hypothetical protein